MSLRAAVSGARNIPAPFEDLLRIVGIGVLFAGAAEIDE
jgi:hypothetical protein